MDSKINKQLADAKALFYSWRMAEAYNVFRRYFDRLPFKPEKEHAEYIGIFVRILAELGKEYELKFYMGELERHYDKLKDPHIAYPLGVIYTHNPEPRPEAAKILFENIIKDANAKEYHGKAKMQLARYYSKKGDIGACRALIDSIEYTGDVSFDPLIDIWKAIVLNEENKLPEAEAAFESIVARLDVNQDWYAYYSAKLYLAMTYVKAQKTEAAQKVAAEVREMFKGKQFKTVQIQLGALEKLIEQNLGMGTLTLKATDDSNTVSYGPNSLTIVPKTPGGKLLLLFLKKKFLDKAMIVKNLYDRQYNGEQDDKLIYYHIHALRKRLKSLGLPSDAISSEDNGYRFVPTVEFA